jgi:hypothetical protein
MSPATAFEREAELLAAEAARATRVKGVYACIAAVSKEMSAEGISKTRTNLQQNYKFRGIDDVFNALAPMLSRHGLVILPRCLSRNVVERQTKTGGVLFYVTIEAEFDFVCVADGSTHTVRMFGEAMDSADKATNKAMSAAYKYAAFQTFCIPTEGEDADAETHDVEPVIHVRPPTPTPTTPPGVVRSGGATPAAAAGGDLRPSDTAAIYPPGVVLIARVDESKTKNPAVTRYLITTSSGEQLNTIKDQLARDAKVFRDQRVPVIPTAKATKWGLELESLARVSDAEAPF